MCHISARISPWTSLRAAIYAARAPARRNMFDDDTELRVLEQYVEHSRTAAIKDPENWDRCSRELSMRDVLRSLGGTDGPGLNFDANFWLTRLAPEASANQKGLLRRCSDTAARQRDHRYHARPFLHRAHSPPPHP